MNDLQSCLIAHEKLKHYAYVDSTNHITCGIGRNLSYGGPGLSTDECLYLLGNDIKRVKQELGPFSWYKNQDCVRQEALLELAFNMGLDGLLSFKDTLNSMEKKDYANAASQLLSSKWALQVGPNRANNIANRIKTGSYD